VILTVLLLALTGLIHIDSIGAHQYTGVGNPLSSFSTDRLQRFAAGSEGTARANGALASPSFWTNITSGPAPSARYGAAMAYDPMNHETVLFGGGDGKYGIGSWGAHNDTWVYRNGTWSNISASVGPAPPARFDANLVYDPKDGYLDLIGGSTAGQSAACDANCNDTWAFSGGHWSRLSTPWSYGLRYVNSAGGASAVYDSTDGYILVLQSYTGGSTQGTTWSVTGSTWTDLSFNRSTNTTLISPNYYWPVLVNDPAAGGVLLFGGDQLVAVNQWELSPFTWFYSRGSWTNITSNSTLTPPAADMAAAAYDAADQAVLLLDGASTWEWKSSQWTNVTSSPSPQGLLKASMTWDGQDNVTLLFGGEGRTNGTNSTWEWSGSPFITGLTVGGSPNPIDAGSSTVFHASFFGGVSPFTYSWSFGDGNSSGLAAPSHVYATPGNYTAKLALTDSAGHSSNGTATISVVPPATVHATATPSPTDVGLPTVFSLGISGGTRNGIVEWHFGDGSAAAVGTATHAYSANGTYTILLWWNDTGGAHLVSTFSLVVNSALGTPVVKATPSAPSLGQLVNFTASVAGGTQPYRYSWAFGDGGTGGNLQNISHIYTTNGPFSLRLTVTDTAMSSTQATLNLTIALNLTMLGQWSAGASPLSVAFTSQVTGGIPGYTYLWRFGDGGTSFNSEPVHTFTLPGDYETFLSVMDSSGHSAEATWWVYVAQGGGPLAATVTAAPATISTGQATLVSASIAGGDGGYTLSWTGGTGDCVTLAALSERCYGLTPGAYSVTLRVTDASGHVATGAISFEVGNGAVTIPPRNSLLGLGSGLFWAALAGIVALTVLAVFLISRRATNARRTATLLDPIPEYRLRLRSDFGSSPTSEEIRPSTGAEKSTGEDPMRDLV
jgi:PKD repeat protein